MMKPKIEELALCVKNEGFPASLELYKAYQVLPDEKAASHGMLRVVDESGEDYLYPRGYFRPIRVLRGWRGDHRRISRQANQRRGGTANRSPAVRG